VRHAHARSAISLMIVFAGSRPAVAARRLGAVSLLVMLLGATLLVAAGGPAAAQAKNAEVDGTAQNKWEPANVTVPVGGTVTFKISGGAPHPVKSGSPPNGDNAFDASACGLAQMNRTGASCKVTFKKAGSFPFFCQVHFSLGMTGTITVGSGGGGATATTAAGSGGTPVVTAPEAARATTSGKPGVFWLGYGLLAMGALLALAALVGYLRFSPGFRRGRR
jgi:plastocyanin